MMSTHYQKILKLLLNFGQEFYPNHIINTLSALLLNIMIAQGDIFNLAAVPKNSRLKSIYFKSHSRFKSSQFRQSVLALSKRWGKDLLKSISDLCNLNIACEKFSVLLPKLYAIGLFKRTVNLNLICQLNFSGYFLEIIFLNLRLFPAVYPKVLFLSLACF